VKLFVVDRVRDFIELYVDHQSAWVPASKVEEEILQRRNEIIEAIPRISSIEQVAVFGDRMLPFLVAVVGVKLVKQGEKEVVFDDWKTLEAELVEQMKRRCFQMKLLRFGFQKK
jgi:hypothetical protein